MWRDNSFNLGTNSAVQLNFVITFFNFIDFTIYIFFLLQDFFCVFHCGLRSAKKDDLYLLPIDMKLSSFLCIQ